MNNKNQQLQDWASRIKRSDHRAFEQFFRFLYPRLVKFVIRYVNDKSTASDIVQEVFMALWKNRSTVDPDQSIQSYMYRAVRNRSLNWLDKKANQGESLDSITIQQHNDEAYIENSNGKLKSEMEIWISELPERQCEAFRLSRFDGLDHTEIAAVMSISEKTVNNHIVAALKYLRKKYDQYKQEQES
ncbi:MAG: RNA polymerase sigma-70 factor [Balneolaceae bacterium]